MQNFNPGATPRELVPGATPGTEMQNFNPGATPRELPTNKNAPGRTPHPDASDSALGHVRHDLIEIEPRNRLCLFFSVFTWAAHQNLSPEQCEQTKRKTSQLHGAS
jgi:hypothetical protein